MEQFPDINRAALIVTPKKPFIDWLVYNSKKYGSSENEFKQEDLKTEGFWGLTFKSKRIIFKSSDIFLS